MAIKPHVIINNESSEDEDSTEEVAIEVIEEVSQNSEEVNNSPVDDNESSANEDESGNEDGNEDIINAAWADSIANILKTNKPKGKKTLVLSKAKKLCDVKIKSVTSVGFQVENDLGERKDEKIVKIVEKPNSETTRRKKKEILSVRTKPDILNRNRERILSKIATKGVVQLFNAVRLQQKDISTKLTEAGPLEVKRDRALKNIDKKSFLNVLMGKKSETVTELESEMETNTKSKEPEEKRNKSRKEPQKEPTWSVLKDDFMMKAKLKDWDKELEEEMEVE